MLTIGESPFVLLLIITFESSEKVITKPSSVSSTLTIVKSFAEAFSSASTAVTQSFNESISCQINVSSYLLHDATNSADKRVMSVNNFFIYIVLNVYIDYKVT